MSLSSLKDCPLAWDASEVTLETYSRTTLPFQYRPAGVVFPQSTEEISALVQFARKQKLPLYPISRGKNWGYGEAMAPRAECLIVDLGRMNRILEVNENLAYAVIEPGVTQGQLFHYLREHHPSLWMDANGAGPEASLVGNLLERGFGHTPTGDRANSCAGFEVVLGTGQRIETGFGRFSNAHAHYTYRPGLGPSLDGLFFQSNFGIVTKIAIWLQRRPEAFAAFFCRLDDATALPLFIDRLRELRLTGVVRSCVHVGNALRALTGIVDYPWEETGGKRPVSAQWVKSAGQARHIGAWNATGGIYGPRGVVDSSVEEIRRALSEFNVIALSDRELEGLPHGLQEAMAPAVGLLKGEPTLVYLRGAAWRSRGDTGGFDPLENKAGLLWMVPTLPATGEHASRVEGIVTRGLHRFGFDAPITLTFVNERTVLATTNISYDRTSTEDTENAWKCYRELVAELLREGYPPYRSGIGGYDLVDPTGAYAQVVSDLREVFDPDRIMSPGRYDGTMTGES